MTSSLIRDLGALLGPEQVAAFDPRAMRDALRGPAIEPRAEAVTYPATAEQVAELLAWCYERGVPITARGGGTGLTGAATPVAGGVVVALERLDRVRSLDALQWRMEVEAGVTTATVQRRARETGLYFPPDPGAAEQSHIGGNIATNAGGPHALRYGVTGDFVMGLEAALPPGELVRLGGPVRKDAAGFDLKRLLIGSEGALGIITAAHLKLLPAPEARLPLVAAFGDARAGCEAVEAIIGSGVQAAAIEYLDGRTLELAGAAVPGLDASDAGFLVIAEADGSVEEAERQLAEIAAAVEPLALRHARPRGREIEELWRWRDGVSNVVATARGGKVSEDIAVPVERLADAIEATLRIGEAHGLDACSWGHAGDANIHATFLVSGDPAPAEEGERVAAAVDELLREAVALGGTVSGEHGLGWLKRDALAYQASPAELELQRGIKQLFDPKGLLNPGKWI